MFQFPHCDARVLHAPSECKFCDEHPDWQELREVWGINFTGHYEGNKIVCPAEVERGVGKVGGPIGWAGNRPTHERIPDRTEVEDTVESLQRIERDLR